MQRIVVAVALGSLATATAVPALAFGGVAAAAPAVSVSPTSGLSNGETLTIRGTGLQPGEMLLAVQCSLVALQIGEDGCENHRNSVFFVDGAGNALTTLVVTSTISTAVGPQSCTSSTCLVGVVSPTASSEGQVLAATALSFSSTSCAPGATVADCDAAPPVPTTVAGAGPPVPAAPPPATGGGPWRESTAITPSTPFSASLLAGVAGDLSPPSSVTGPYPSSGEPATAPPPAAPVSGAGLLQLSMDAPGTSWSSNTDKAVVVQASVDGGAPQQIVLFAGSRPFTYAGFTGPLQTGAHEVSVEVASSLSTTGDAAPEAELLQARLSVVPEGNPAYLLERYAPVIYGRADSASSDTQLLTYGTAQPMAGGAVHLSYETIWSKEDAGTSFVPFLEGGEWGRMTDITATVSLDVSAAGAISNPMFNYCGCQVGFPENRQSLAEVSVPFHGSFFDGTHMIVRNASGNDYQSDVGTTAFRFQQAPVRGPVSGALRETAMDASPWTYRIMDQEVRAWYLDRSSDPRSPEPGDSRQYAIVELATSSTGVAAVGVDLRLAGDPAWYANDFGSGFPLFTGGEHRTVVKLPPRWQNRAITGVRLRVYPPSAAASLRVSSVRVLALTHRFDVVDVPVPSAEVAPGTPETPPAAAISRVSGAMQRAASGDSFPQALGVRVTDASGSPVPGLTVEFTTPATGPTATFPGGGHLASPVSDASGVATSPALVAGQVPGTYDVTASVQGFDASTEFSLQNLGRPPVVHRGPPSLFGGRSFWAFLLALLRYLLTLPFHLAWGL